MNEEAKKGENGFRSILKGTSVFGGVQVFNILVSAVRLKFVAILLGPAGMAVAALYNSASLTIQQFASLGLNLSVVKEIGRNKSDESRLGDILSAIRPLIVMSALIGALVCLLFPTLLSSVTFGDDKYRTGYIFLSAAVFFSIAGVSLMSVLQGLHAVKPLSKASLIGSTVGLAVGVPLYWAFGTGGIVPAMIALAFATCLWYYLSLRKALTVSASPWNRDVHLPILKKILFMGLILMSNDLMRNLVNFIINIVVRIHGGYDDVGFFQSCNTMTAQYSAIVFTAMAMDYLPRLSAVASDNREMCKVVNRQMEVVGLLITPVVAAVIFLAPWVIQIFQTKAFLVATPLLRLLAAAVTLRALMYPLGYIVFAKDNRRLFFWMESIGANLLTLALTCGGFALFGLQGLGYAAICDCAICLVVYILVNHRLYGYRLSMAATRIMTFAIAVTAIVMIISFSLEGIIMITLNTIILVSVSTISLKMLWIRIKK